MEVPLTRRMFAVVDNEDFEMVSRFRWTAQKCLRTWYARRNATIGPVTVPQLMHTLITGFAETDHIDGDGLNNQRSNLRAATRAQNHQNARKHRGSSSRFKGVFWRKGHQRWIVQIYIAPRQRLHLGSFRDEAEAGLAYDRAARLHFGTFAALNFPEPGERSALVD